MQLESLYMYEMHIPKHVIRMQKCHNMLQQLHISDWCTWQGTCSAERNLQHNLSLIFIGKTATYRDANSLFVYLL
jgi:hypothetical protein